MFNDWGVKDLLVHYVHSMSIFLKLIIQTVILQTLEVSYLWGLFFHLNCLLHLGLSIFHTAERPNLKEICDLFCIFQSFSQNLSRCWDLLFRHPKHSTIAPYYFPWQQGWHKWPLNPATPPPLRTAWQNHII